MIVHEKKAIFVHIPKCAGTSVELCILKDLGVDYSNRLPFGMQINENHEVGPPRLAHLTLREMIDYHYLSEDIVSDYFVFTIVRNPISRVRSFYNYLGYSKWIDINTFIKKVLNPEFEDRGANYWFLKPQHEYISPRDCDVLLKLEQLSDEWSQVAKQLRLKNDLEHANISDKANAKSRALKALFNLLFKYRILPNFSKSMLNKDGKDEILRLYGEDFKKFNYQVT